MNSEVQWNTDYPHPPINGIAGTNPFFDAHERLKRLFHTKSIKIHMRLRESTETLHERQKLRTPNFQLDICCC